MKDRVSVACGSWCMRDWHTCECECGDWFSCCHPCPPAIVSVHRVTADTRNVANGWNTMGTTTSVECAWGRDITQHGDCVTACSLRTLSHTHARTLDVRVA